MKNVFVVLAFMLMSSLAFAGSGEKAELGSSADVKIENLVGVGEDESHDINLIAEKDSEFAKSCTVKVDLIITDKDGNPVKVQGTFTIEGQSCGEVLKQAMAK